MDTDISLSYSWSVDHHCVLDLPFTYLAIIIKFSVGSSHCLSWNNLPRTWVQRERMQEEKHLISPQNGGRGRAEKRKAKYKQKENENTITLWKKD